MCLLRSIDCLLRIGLLTGFMCLSKAQLQDLSATADGRELFFSTSYRTTGTDQPGYLKIFRYSDGKLDLTRAFKQSELGPDSNFFRAERPSVSSDGKIFAYTRTRDCAGGSHCVAFDYDDGWIAQVGREDQHIGPGMLDLSPDGRYALVFNLHSSLLPQPTGILDIEKSALSAFPAGFSVIGDGRHSIANGGVALVANSRGAALLRGGTIQRLNFAMTPINARINATATTVLYEAISANRAVHELHSYDVATGRDLALASSGSGDERNYFHASLTQDGSIAVFIRDGDFEAQRTDGSLTLLHLVVMHGANDVIVSGSGNIAFIASTSGGLIQVSMSTGQKTYLVPDTPHLSIEWGAVVPGSRLDVAFAYSLGDPTAETQAGRAARIGRNDNFVTFQIPWNAMPGDVLRLSFPDNPSPFEEVHELSVLESQPVLFTQGNEGLPYAVAAHEDFSGLVTPDSPAVGGEILHFYMTGLGVVTGNIATGSPTPIGTIFYAKARLSCTFIQGQTSTQALILFAGLAPTFIGVNQVDVIAPRSLDPGLVDFVCETNSSSAFGQISYRP